MAGIGLPDYVKHNNYTSYPIVLGNDVEGGPRTVADLTALYALSTIPSKLKEYVTRVYVQSNGKTYLLTDDTNIGSSAGWTDQSVSGNVLYGSMAVTLDGQGSVLTTGEYGRVYVPYAGTITSWQIDTAPGVSAGSLVVDLYRSGSTIIGAGNKPTLSSATTNSAAVSGWTSVAITAGDNFTFYISSVTGITAASVVFYITKS